MVKNDTKTCATGDTELSDEDTKSWTRESEEVIVNNGGSNPITVSNHGSCDETIRVVRKSVKDRVVGKANLDMTDELPPNLHSDINDTLDLDPTTCISGE